VNEDERFPCCEHCDHPDFVEEHFYPCGGPSCQKAEERAQRAEAERRDTERIRRELLDQLDAGGPEFQAAVARNLTINAAASQLDAIAEAINEETR
jgi:hypothetical protein